MKNTAVNQINSTEAQGLEHASGLTQAQIADIEKAMMAHFREELRIAPQFIWLPPETLPRETGKIKLIEMASK